MKATERDGRDGEHKQNTVKDVGPTEHGKSFEEYFKALPDKTGKNLNEVVSSIALPADSFGQWHEADEGADD